MKFSGRPLSQRWARWPQWALAVLACCVGGWLASGFWHDDIQALEQLRETVARLQSQLQPQVSEGLTPDARPEGADLVSPPDSLQATQAWPWLQRRLQAHSLQLLALRPGPLESSAQGQTQTVALEVQGRWSDWLAFERMLHQHAPWWTVSQWQVVPGGEVGQTRMQWHVRWGWRVPGAQQPLAFEFPHWSVAMAPEASAHRVFDEPQRTASAVQADERAPALPADSGRWPVATLRLHGVWQQNGVAHAVLAAGQHPLVVAPGQRVGLEDYRVHQVTADEVVLQPLAAGGREVRLGWRGGSR